MVQRLFSGRGAAEFLERVTPGGIRALKPYHSTLTCLMKEDESGGIVDDMIVTRLEGDEYYVVTNAACREKDDAYFDEQVEKWNGVKMEGRLSEPLIISRGGYTGEDGFEISMAGEDTVGVTEALLAAGPEKVQLAGLGARDSLRLEAGMCLYGHDLDETTTPVEAGLSWIIPKERRNEAAQFYGAKNIAGQLVAKSKGGKGVDRRRVGLIVEGAPAREGAEIVSRAEDGKESVSLGKITSGCPSPSLGRNIAMGYIKDGFHKAGTEVDVLVRGRPRKAVIAKMPFVPTKYYKGEA
ncbi:Aminomethyltransferase, mitochondrial [Collariella sp. IMI 366227]|nr:Aminomethyltransferase, mitochondrial [Collariella sp. IMI 366227]